MIILFSDLHFRLISCVADPGSWDAAGLADGVPRRDQQGSLPFPRRRHGSLLAQPGMHPSVAPSCSPYIHMHLLHKLGDPLKTESADSAEKQLEIVLE